MDGVLVSIIIPTYRCEPFVAQAIRSALSQTYNSIEVIVVNNSEEKANMVDDIVKPAASECTEGRRLTLLHSKNEGASAARNLGIQNASGKYVHFLDGDDIIVSEKVKEQVKVLESSGSGTISYTDFRYFYGDTPEQPFQPQFHRGDYSGQIFKELLREGNFIAMDSALIPRDALIKAGGVSGKRLIDWYLWLRLSLTGCRFLYLDKVMLFVRKVPGSLSSDPLGMAESRVEVLSSLTQSVSDAELQREIDVKLGNACIILAGRQVRRGHFGDVFNRVVCAFSAYKRSGIALVLKDILLRIVFRCKHIWGKSKHE